MIVTKVYELFKNFDTLHILYIQYARDEIFQIRILANVLLDVLIVSGFMRKNNQFFIVCRDDIITLLKC